MTKTEEALKYIEEGLTPYAAAKKAGITPTTVYVAMKRIAAEKAQGVLRCPCCGQKLPKQGEMG